MNLRDKSAKLLLFLILFASGLAAVSVRFVPFSVPMPPYMVLARQLAVSGRLSDYLPVLYPGLLAWGLKAGGLKGIFAAQALLYVLTVLSAFALLRALKASARAAFLSALVVACHPYLLLNIKRIVENSLAVPFLIWFVLGLVLLSRERVNVIRAIAASVVFGAMIYVRANFIFLAALPAVVIFVVPGRAAADKARLFALVYGAASATAFLIAVGLTGHFFLLPGVGPYNLFHGANPHTAESLLQFSNTSHSFMPAVKDYGIDLRRRDLDAIFVRYAVDFILKHPFQYLYLAFLKLYILFRPDLRLMHASGMVRSPLVFSAAQAVLSLPVFVWLFFRLKDRSLFSFRPPWAFWIVFLYLLPCLLTNADPRYRLPVDIFFILDIGFVLSVSIPRV